MGISILDCWRWLSRYGNDCGDCETLDDPYGVCDGTATTGGGTTGGTTTGGDGECPAGYVDDCAGDGDCCLETWIGDGYCDDETQEWGCDLMCYDEDGGDCAGTAAAPEGDKISIHDSAYKVFNSSNNQSREYTDYRIYRGTFAGGPYTLIAEVDGSVYNYEDASVANNTTYYYVVTSVWDDVLESEYSNEASATPEPFVSPVPENLVATAGDSQVSLSWDAVEDNSGGTGGGTGGGTDGGATDGGGTTGGGDDGPCSSTFVVFGSDASVGDCYTDGTGYYSFVWEGGCLATNMNYSAGDLDLTSYGFTEGFFFYGFEPGSTETFTITFDDNTSAYQTATNDCATCAELGQIECWDGSCADTQADCPAEGDCGEGYVIDCADLDCCLESWIGDGFPRL